MKLGRCWASIAFCAVMAGFSVPTADASVVVVDGGFVVQGSTPEVRQQIDVAHDAGARWISLGISWETLEPTPDGYTTLGGPGSAAWTDLQDRLAYAKSRDMDIEVRLTNAPGWASGRSGVSDDPPTPANLPAYAGFLTDLGARLGGYIDAYSPWNEPNRVAFWNPIDPDAFTALQKAAYPAIKASDPTATVLYGPVVGRYLSQNSGYTFLRRSYQLGLKGYADVIGWNGYPGGQPESPAPVENGVPAANTLPAQLYLRDLINQYDPGRRVWIMEMGWSTCVQCNVSAANGATEVQQADYLTRAFDYRRRYLSGITDKIFWYQVKDTGTDRGDWFQNQGVLHADHSPKPALAAFRALGVEVPDGAATGSAPLPAAPVRVLSATAARLRLPVRASSRRGSVTLRKPKATARRGVFTLTFRVSLKGPKTTIRVEGYRGRKWRPISRVTIRRSGTLRLKIRDKGFVGFRIRATVPGRSGFRVGRVVKVPAKYLRVTS